MSRCPRCKRATPPTTGVELVGYIPTVSDSPDGTKCIEFDFTTTGKYPAGTWQDLIAMAGDGKVRITITAEDA